MAKAKGVSLTELAALQKKEAAVARFTAEDERRHALILLGELAELNQTERGRVLRRALKINDV